MIVLRDRGYIPGDRIITSDAERERVNAVPDERTSVVRRPIRASSRDYVCGKQDERGWFYDGY